MGLAQLDTRLNRLVLHVKAALKLVFARQTVARPYAAPPGVPPKRLKAPRDAFDSTMKDPEFPAEASGPSPACGRGSTHASIPPPKAVGGVRVFARCATAEPRRVTCAPPSSQPFSPQRVEKDYLLG